MRNAMTLRCAISAVSLTLTSYPALAQEAPVGWVLEGREVQPEMENCQIALERGQILKTDETGAYHIAAGDLYFVISVDETQMTCRAYRHVYRS